MQSIGEDLEQQKICKLHLGLIIVTVTLKMWQCMLKLNICMLMMQYCHS